MPEQNKNINKEVEIMKRNQTQIIKLKSTVTELKYSADGSAFEHICVGSRKHQTTRKQDN